MDGAEIFMTHSKLKLPEKICQRFYVNYWIRDNLIETQKEFMNRRMLTLESRCILVVGGGVLILRTMPNP